MRHFLISKRFNSLDMIGATLGSAFLVAGEFGMSVAVTLFFTIVSIIVGNFPCK